jgi:hypothetical protein
MSPLPHPADRVAHRAINALTVARGRVQLMRRRWDRDDVDCARDLDELAVVEAEIDRAVGLLEAVRTGAIVVIEQPGGDAFADA